MLRSAAFLLCGAVVLPLLPLQLLLLLKFMFLFYFFAVTG
jgi:hypothetical protein